MALNIEYQLRPSYAASFNGGTIRLDEIRTVDIEAMLDEGEGTIVADSTDGVLIGALDAYPALMRTGTTEDPPLPIFSTTPLRVRAEGERTLDLEGAGENFAVVTDADGNLTLSEVATPASVAAKVDQSEFDAALASVVRGGSITTGTATPSDLDDGSIYLQTASGQAAELYLTPGASFGQVLALSAPPSSLAPDQVAAVVVGGNVTEIYIGASA